MTRLADQVAATASWTGRFGAMADSLASSLVEWNEPNRMAIEALVGRPLLELAGSGSATCRRWARLLVLDSPHVRRSLKVVLIEQLSKIGVFRDVGDLQDVGTSSVGFFVAATLRRSRKDVGKFMEFVCEGLEQRPAPGIAAAEATLLGMMLQPAEIQELSHAGHREKLTDVLDLAYWISVSSGGHPERMNVSCPSSMPSRVWFETRAFRGLRRHWARKYGCADGTAGVTSLPGWLLFQESSPTLPEGYGAMIVEWALAAFRHWPDRRQMLRDPAAELEERVAALRTQVDAVLQYCDGSGALTEWLNTSLQKLFTTPVKERRLIRHAN